MNDPFPIGKREDQTLEFKAAEALKNPTTIAREVVAMLNANGGEVWVGIRDHEDVATSVDSIRNAEVARKALLDHLLSVIDPALQDRDLKIYVESDGERSALRIRVTTDNERKPFAFMKDGSLHFVRRFDHRVRAMTRQEIFGTVDASSATRIRELRERAWKKPGSKLWLGLDPDHDLGWNVQDDSLARFIREPQLSGNRHIGWTFVRKSAGAEPTRELKRGRREFGYADFAVTTLHESGSIEFAASLDWLRNSLQPPKEIHPVAMFEAITSILRLASALYRRDESENPSEIRLDWFLAGLKEWTLPVHPPGTYGYDDEAPRSTEEVNLSAHHGPLTVPASKLHENPDRLGFDIVREIYEAFGLTEQYVPLVYDRKTQRLTLTD